MFEKIERMIVYSVTVTIDPLIEQDWTNWMNEVHIPDVMATGYFSEAHLQRMVEPAPEMGLTYNVQYLCENMEKFHEYQEKAAPALQKDHTERYKDRFVAFRTILERKNSY